MKSNVEVLKEVRVLIIYLSIFVFRGRKILKKDLREDLKHTYKDIFQLLDTVSIISVMILRFLKHTGYSSDDVNSIKPFIGTIHQNLYLFSENVDSFCKNFHDAAPMIEEKLSLLLDYKKCDSGLIASKFTELASTSSSETIFCALTLLYKRILNEIDLRIPYTDLTHREETIVRSIEFPPEYHQAGVSILNYFGTVLRRKCPEKKAKVRIEQDGLKVTLIVDPEEGEREVVEQTLDQYGLVVVGKILPEEFTDDPLLLMELKNELRMAKVRIESQTELLQYQDVKIQKRDVLVEKLLSLVGQAIQSPEININIDVSPEIITQISQQLEFSPRISLIQGGLKELKEKMPESEEAEMVQELYESLKEIKGSHSPEEIKESTAMSKMHRFLEDLDKAGSKLGQTIKGIKYGIDIVQKLAGHYNSIAQWLGLPQVPKPFLKDN